MSRADSHPVFKKLKAVPSLGPVRPNPYESSWRSFASKPYYVSRPTYEEPKKDEYEMDLLEEIMLPEKPEEAQKVRDEAKKKWDDAKRAEEEDKRRWATVTYRGKVYRRPENLRQCKLPPGWAHSYKVLVHVQADPLKRGEPKPVWPECKEDGSCCWWRWYDYHAPRQRPALPSRERKHRPTKQEVLDAIEKNGKAAYFEE